jgi:hypothetical protein
MALNSKLEARDLSKKEKSGLRSVFTIKWFIIYWFIFGLIGYLLGFRFTMEKNTFDLLVTAIIPAFASLLAFLGIFAVFRLQIQESKISNARDGLIALYPVGDGSDEELIGAINKRLVENPPDDNSWFRGGNREELIKRKQRLEERLNETK